MLGAHTGLPGRRLPLGRPRQQAHNSSGGGGSSSSSSSSSSSRLRRAVAAQARRGRPPSSLQPALPEDDGGGVAPTNGPAAAAQKRRGRPRKTDVLPQQPHEPHERLISYEGDITSSVELDYTSDASIVVPSYTHQAQGHDSNTAPPLDTHVPDVGAAGFVGEEALAAAGRPAAAAAAAPFSAAAGGSGPSGRQLFSRRAAGPGVLSPLAGAGGDGQLQQVAEDEDPFGGEEPPGVFDYEAGLAFAATTHTPARQMEFMPPDWRPSSRKEADYMIRWLNWTATLERQDRQAEYEADARRFMAAQNWESENHYLTAKALAVVMAEVELEDHQTGNRWDNFYPIWARAEHRWYPSGRFAAYNAYIKDNIGELTMKLAPGADQEEDFDIMDDVFLMADEPGAPGSQAGGQEDEQAGPAGGLALDGFIAGVLPGTSSSELGGAYLDEVLAPADEEAVEEELE